MTTGEAPTTPATPTTIAFVTTTVTTRATSARMNLVVTGKEEETGIENASVVLGPRTAVWIAWVGRRLHHRVRSLIVAAKGQLTSVVVGFLSATTTTTTTQRMHAVPLALSRRITEAAVIEIQNSIGCRRGKQTERPKESPGETLLHRHHRRRNAKGHEARHLAAHTINPPTLHSTDAIPVTNLNTAKDLGEDSRSEVVSQVVVDSVEEVEEEEKHPDEGETGEETSLVA